MSEITSISTNLPSAFSVFSKELDINGVKIYAVSQITDIQLNYVGNVLKELLSKENTGILTNMVKNGAGLTMFANADQRDSAQGQMVFESSPNRMFQDLQADEIIPPGTSSVRDATVEEVTHLIHNSGITAAKPNIQIALDLATKNAIAAGLFHPEKFTDLPTTDYDDEYLAAGVEAYYSVTHQDLVNEGIYAASTYDQLKSMDPALFAIIEQLFPATIPTAQGTSIVNSQANFDRIFNWGESIAPNLLPEKNDSQEISGYYARLYSNGNAVGEKDDNIWFYDGSKITLIGSVDTLLSQADLGGF